MRAEATVTKRFLGASNKMVPTARATDKPGQEPCLASGLRELGSQGWVLRVFCNYFPFVLPEYLVNPLVKMPAGLSCAKRNDKGVLCAFLSLCFNGGI